MLVTLRQLEYIIAVADCGSFSKAADICAADQSTVSQQVKVMEERLGIEIFDRNFSPVKITEKGKILIEQAREILIKVDDMVKPFKTKNTLFR